MEELLKMSDKLTKKIVWSTLVSKQHALVNKIYETIPRKQDLLISKLLVGDEIQRRKTETRRGWARVENLR